MQCNINGLSTYATRIKLDALLDLAETLEVQIIALQETKLKEHVKLKIKDYHILRSDRQTKGGGGLAFLIRDVNYCQIDTPHFNNSDLELQCIKVNWKGKRLHIFNMYHPPNQKSLPTNIFYINDENSILLGDLNAKHST